MPLDNLRFLDQWDIDMIPTATLQAISDDPLQTIGQQARALTILARRRQLIALWTRDQSQSPVVPFFDA